MCLENGKLYRPTQINNRASRFWRRFGDPYWYSAGLRPWGGETKLSMKPPVAFRQTQYRLGKSTRKTAIEQQLGSKRSTAEFAHFGLSRVVHVAHSAPVRSREGQQLRGLNINILQSVDNSYRDYEWRSSETVFCPVSSSRCNRSYDHWSSYVQKD